MSWGLITEDWRIKLLALGLAVLMLGAVAFSQNPPTTKTLTVPLNYSTTKDIVLINPPLKTTVTYSGLADVIPRVDASNLIATVDATRANPGNAVRLNVRATSLIGNVSVQNPQPIAVDIDTIQTKEVPLTINAPTAPGWGVSKKSALCPISECTSVTFTGPLSWETNLTASVTNPGVIGPTTGCSGQICTVKQPNLQVVLRNANGLLDLSAIRTIPAATLDPVSVWLQVDAVAGVTSSTVPLVIAPPSQPPPQGYSITGVTITPATVVISGDPGVLGRMQRITLPAEDLSKSTSDATFQIQIPYPNGTSGSVALVTVVYSISRNPQVSPGPGP